MKEALTMVINTLTQEDFHGAFEKLLERYNKYIAAEGDYFEGDEFHVCKSAHTKKKIWKLSYTPPKYNHHMFSAHFGCWLSKYIENDISPFSWDVFFLFLKLFYMTDFFKLVL